MGTSHTLIHTYDPLGRLVAAAYSTGECFQYEYDAVGNRAAMTETTSFTGTLATAYQYDAANRLTSAGGVAYTWDDRGNLASDGVFTYTYNAAGRMVRAESVTNPLVYTYSAAGLRVGQSVDGRDPLESEPPHSTARQARQAGQAEHAGQPFARRAKPLYTHPREDRPTPTPIRRPGAPG